MFHPSDSQPDALFSPSAKHSVSAVTPPRFYLLSSCQEGQGAGSVGKLGDTEQIRLPPHFLVINL
jgi:hypothetical protein